MYAQACKGCGLYVVKSVPCKMSSEMISRDLKRATTILKLKCYELWTFETFYTKQGVFFIHAFIRFFLSWQTSTSGEHCHVIQPSCWKEKTSKLLSMCTEIVAGEYWMSDFNKNKLHRSMEFLGLGYGSASRKSIDPNCFSVKREIGAQ